MAGEVVYVSASRTPPSPFDEWRVIRSPLNPEKYVIRNERAGQIAIWSVDDFGALVLAVEGLRRELRAQGVLLTEHELTLDQLLAAEDGP